MRAASPPPSLESLRKQLRAAGDPARARGVASFFKTGPGEYGYGDRFLGIRVPDVRRIARDGRGLAQVHALALLDSQWHEERLLALLLLVDAHERAPARERLAIHREYLAHAHQVNNWDLVDTSAPTLVGSHVSSRGVAVLRRLARSTSLWERRIAIVATLWTIRQDNLAPTFEIAERLLDDDQDLIHKATGWMLREAGKRDGTALRAFLDRQAGAVPRTALRYAIERFDAVERRRYLSVRSDVSGSNRVARPAGR